MLVRGNWRRGDGLKIFLIALFGAIGTLARYGLQGVVQIRMGGAFPYGTLLVNLSGCFLLGLMSIHIGESDKWHGKPLHEAIVEMLRKEKFSGATVLRGVGGFGSSSVYHTDKILRLSQDLPIVVEVVESTERIEQILPRLDEMVEGGLITLEKARVVLYRAAKK